VSIVEGDPGKENLGHAGQFSGNIVLQKNLSRSRLADTIAHELLHARESLFGRLGQNVRFNLAKYGIGAGRLEHQYIEEAGSAIGRHFEQEERAGRPVIPFSSPLQGIVLLLPNGDIGFVYNLDW
jgi:hypothetical protein